MSSIFLVMESDEEEFSVHSAWTSEEDAQDAQQRARERGGYFYVCAAPLDQPLAKEESHLILYHRASCSFADYRAKGMPEAIDVTQFWAPNISATKTEINPEQLSISVTGMDKDRCVKALQDTVAVTWKINVDLATESTEPYDPPAGWEPYNGE